MLLELVSATAASALEGATEGHGRWRPARFRSHRAFTDRPIRGVDRGAEALLFDPVLKVFALREDEPKARVPPLAKLQEKAGELLQRYETELERVKQVAAEERDLLRAETSKLEAEILREARDATTRIVEEGRRKIEVEVNSIRVAVGAESEKVAQMIVERVVGQGIN